MPAMFSYPHRQKSGQITCYLNRTYHVLTTGMCVALDTQTPGRVAYCPLLRGCLVCPRFLLSGWGPENSGIFRSGKQVPPRLQGGFEITSLLIVTKQR